MNNETLAIVVAVIAIVVAGYSVYKAHQTGTEITGTFLQSELQEATSTAKEIADVALTAVRASEQLFNDGRIRKDERFSKAVHYIRRWFPDIDEDVLITNLEAAVMIVNTLVNSLPKKEGLP